MSLSLLCAAAPAQSRQQERQPRRGPEPPARQEPAKPASPAENYTTEQAVSDKAQLHTIAFNGLAFMTGTFGADTFLPPGKAADFFGFQHMRDIDRSEAGHNMNFLTRIANATLAILTDSQKAQLVELAREQEPLYRRLAMLRLPLIKAFRENMEGAIPAGSSGLSREAVRSHVAAVFEVDGLLAYRRAEVCGAIIRSLDPSQTARLRKLSFGDSSTWPDLPEQIDRRLLSHEQDVAVMTYASELFSWHAGSVESDVYFCPERHGTYFGGFYMKDYPAMGNADYFISTSLTGDSGDAFLTRILTPRQGALITEIIDVQRKTLEEIVSVRTAISKALRGFIAGTPPSRDSVLALARRYGELDGEVSHLYATRFAQVYRTLTAAQKQQMVALRNQSAFPKGAYLYADAIETPRDLDTTRFIGRQP